MLAHLGMLMIFGISRSAIGDSWIVSLPCSTKTFDDEICAWCESQFGYVDLGACLPRQVQDFWFNQEEHAVLCWLT
jgi:hypothetical protein